MVDAGTNVASFQDSVQGIAGYPFLAGLNAEDLALLPRNDDSVNSRGRRVRQCSWKTCLALGSAMIGLASSTGLKVYNLRSEEDNVMLDTTANFIMGVSLAALAQASDCAKAAKDFIFNRIKRWSIPLFEIGTNIYLNVNQTPLAQQLFYTPVVMGAGLLFFDDIVTLATMKEAGSQRLLGDTPMPMLEGDAKSWKRMALNQGAILTLGVALIALGFTLHGDILRNVLQDVGISACTYAFGTAVAQQTWALVERLDKQYQGTIRPLLQNPMNTSQHIPPPPRLLRLLNGVVKFFQLGFPQGFAISVVPNSPIGYGFSGFLWGAGRQITRTSFQYTMPVEEQVTETGGIFSRIKRIWNRRKEDIILNSAFFATISGWLAWGETVGHTARIRGGVGSVFAPIVGFFLANGLIDELWKPSSSGWKNSLFFNTVALSPAAFVYLFMQTKLDANDIFLTNTTPFGYACGIAALIALGAAIGQDRWSQMREGRTEPALTPTLSKSFLSWTTLQRFLGYL